MKTEITLNDLSCNKNGISLLSSEADPENVVIEVRANCTCYSVELKIADIRTALRKIAVKE